MVISALKDPLWTVFLTPFNVASFLPPSACPQDLANSVKFKGQPKGQSIAITLGTMATCRWPVMVDLTDGAVHHLMCLKGNRLIVWEGLSPTEAYNKIAMALNADKRALDLDSTLDTIDEDNQEEDGDLRAVKRLRSSIQCTSLLRNN